MINPGKSFNIHDYIEIFLRRLWYIVIPFAVVISAAAVYSLTTPPKYRASTVILVTPQKVPVDYVRPTVTSRIEDRLQSIGQEIMSRTRLEQVIAEFKLYEKEAKTLALEEIVELMRKDITVQIRGREGYFTISYVGKDPRTVTMVTNKLASLFIEENLMLREQQAQGTSEFLSLELNATKTKLDEQERMISQFKRQFLYELPDQRPANLSILGRLNEQVQQTGDSLKAAQDRKLIIHKQLAEMKNMAALLPQSEGPEESISATGTPGSSISLSRKNPYLKQLEQLRNQLSELEMKYTEKHPDIVITKKRIGDIEKKIEASQKESEAIEEKVLTPPKVVASTSGSSRGKGKEVPMDFVHKEMEDQLFATETEIQRLKEEQSRIKAKIAEFQTRIENAPVRELAMANLSRDYQNVKEHYESLLKKSQEAQQAENLERRQKGEQFKVIDPARIPEKPFRPNIPRILLVGFLLGTISGFGMAFLKEQTDRSFRDAEDLEATLGFRVLANIPKIEKKAA